MRYQDYLAAIKMSTYLYIIALSVNKIYLHYKSINNITILESNQDVIISKRFIVRDVVFSHQISCY